MSTDENLLFGVAAAAYREAVGCDPRHASDHFHLGVALERLGSDAEAEAAYREAITRDPKYIKARLALGALLGRNGAWDHAAAAFREAILLDPKSALAHYGLGGTLARQGEDGKAEASFREALKSDPKSLNAHLGLGIVLGSQGKLADAARAYRGAIDAGHPDPELPARVARLQRLADLGQALTAYLAGELKPAGNDDRSALVALCHARRMYGAAVRLSADALAADPKLIEDVKACHRYNAACYAARAAGGKGEDDPKPDDKELSRLRGLALSWLRAELSLWAKRLDADRAAVAAKMKHWQTDADLAGLRGEKAIATLPDAERDPWRKLWANVAALRAKAEKK